MNRKCGFTLAEILVTLSLIGIVSALTVPSLLSSTNSKEVYAQVSKAYNMIANATSTIEAKHGRPRFWDWDTVVEEEYLKIFKTTGCKGSSCFGNDGDRWLWINENKFITLDGMYWYYTVDSECDDRHANDIYNNTCLKFEVDVNGGKGPNKIGKDLFGFVVTRQGAYPMGGCPGCSNLCDSEYKGSIGMKYSCTATLLKEGKL